MHPFRYLRQSNRLIALLYLPLVALLTACGGFGSHRVRQGFSEFPMPFHRPPIGYSIHKAPEDTCPADLSHIPTCQTPHSLRMAYGVESLIERGMTGKGQTIIDIVSFGSPTLQKDVDGFDRQFGLPSIKLQILSPIGSVPFNPANSNMNSWATETTLDVELIHAIAPGANIVVLTSPVDETEGIIGLPEFFKLEQYAVDHHLGQIFSQSYVASETTLNNPSGRQLVQNYADFYQKITTREGWTVLNGSGDHGATDYIDLASTKFSSTPIVNFPADVPWVTSVGGTTLISDSGKVKETAWNGSGGGLSAFFSEPDYQQSLPANLQGQLHRQRGIPDIAANADPLSSMAVLINGQWQQVGGTSAATPTWAGMIAIANQMAGHPLGFINPALYQLATSSKAASDFRDITSGNNSFNQGNLSVRGFSASAGWDAVTGWGAPIGEKLLPDLIAAAKH
ncbi:MAG TPA: S53 family peptidase [Ktedonobacteraceae bacterium]